MERDSASARSGEASLMERDATKSVEISGEKDPVEQYASKDLKAAAAAIGPYVKAGAAMGPYGLFAMCSIKGKVKVDIQAAASDVERAFGMAVVATAMAQYFIHTAKQAAALAAAAKQAEEDAAAKQAEVAVAAAAIDDDAADSEDGMDGMTSMEYIKTYKELPLHEVELFMQHPVERTPFTDTKEFKDLSADPYTTQDDIDKAWEEHEERLDMRTRFHDWVRNEYDTKGYVAVSEEYITSRARIQEFSSKLWEEVFANFDGDSDFEDEVEEVAH